MGVFSFDFYYFQFSATNQTNGKNHLIIDFSRNFSSCSHNLMSPFYHLFDNFSKCLRCDQCCLEIGSLLETFYMHEFVHSCVVSERFDIDREMRNEKCMHNTFRIICGGFFTLFYCVHTALSILIKRASVTHISLQKLIKEKNAKYADKSFISFPSSLHRMVRFKIVYYQTHMIKWK